MKDLVDKAEVLVEALPYIRRFFGKIIVIKYGGHAMSDAELRASFAVDVVLLKFVGVQPVIVHGGGPQIAETLERLGKQSMFVGGLRVTDDETMDVVEMVLGGKVNREIVELVQQAGGRAVGLTGSDGGMLRARQRDPSLGRVGEVISVDPDSIRAVTQAGFIPVIAPVGADENGVTYNINADEAAGAIAAALRAEKLMLLTDVEGVLDGAGQLIPHITADEVGKLVSEATIQGGMIPKVECCVDALRGGVARTHIVDGRIRHSILLEMFTDEGGAGTLLIS